MSELLLLVIVVGAWILVLLAVGLRNPYRRVFPNPAPPTPRRRRRRARHSSTRRES